MRVRTLAAALGAAALLSACGQTGAGVAARVGDARIATADLAARVARTYEDPQFAQRTPKDRHQRDLLNTLIEHELVKVAAKRLGVSVSQQQVDDLRRRAVENAGGEEAFRRQAAAEGVHLDDVDEALRRGLLRNAVMDKLVEDEVVSEEQLRTEYRRRLADYDKADVAHISLREPGLAARVAKRAKAPGADFAALARRFSEDTDSREQGGRIGEIGNGPGQYAQEFVRAIFRAKEGEVVGPLRTVTGNQNQIVIYEVFTVLKRTTRTFDEVREEVRRSLLLVKQNERYGALMTDLVREFDIEVNPRFGRWDPQRNGVVPAQGGLSNPEPEPGGAVPGVQPGPVGPPGGQPGGQPGQPPGGQPGQPGQQPPGQPGATVRPTPATAPPTAQ